MNADIVGCILQTCVALFCFVCSCSAWSACWLVPLVAVTVCSHRLLVLLYCGVEGNPKLQYWPPWVRHDVTLVCGLPDLILTRTVLT